MTEHAFNTIYKETLDNLQKRRLTDALAAVRRLATEANDWETNERCDHLTAIYRNMLSYAFRDIADPQQQNIYHNLIDETYALADKARQTWLMRYSVRLPYERMRTLSTDKTWHTDLTATDAHIRETAESHLFDYFWLMPWNEELRTLGTKILVDETVANRAKCALVSAVTLSLLRTYHTEGLQVLLGCGRLAQTDVRQRAIVGLLLVLAHHADRIARDEMAMALINLLLNDDRARKELLTNFLLLVRTSETPTITRHIRDEIMPDMMRLSPKLKDKLASEQLNQEDLEGLIDDLDFTHKMQEFSDLQMDGADVYAETFASLKSFSFFDSTINWLLPFDTQHSAIANVIGGNNNLFAKIVSMPQLCNSDKYSFCLSLMQMPENQRNAIINATNAESDQWQEMMSDETMKNPNASVQIVANQYVCDLYRLYTQHPRKTDFENPLPDTVTFCQSALFADIFANIDDRLQIAEYYFAKKLYKECIPQFKALLAKADNKGEILQHLGYCYQQEKEYNAAIEAYKMADLHQPDKRWTLMRWAFCNMRLGDYENAITLYNKCLATQPNDFKTLLKLGYCYQQSHRYKEAVATYFEADNLQPDDPDCLRAVAWCYLLDGQTAKACKQYDKLLLHAPEGIDWLNAGHAHLVSGNKAQALSCYQQSRAKYANHNDFDAALIADQPILANLGVPAADFALLCDALKLL